MELSEKDRRFLQQLPQRIQDDLLEKLRQYSTWEALIEHFKKSSVVSRMLMKDPGTFEMLEIVYTEQILDGVIDTYLLNSLSAQALRYRLKAVISYLVNQIGKMVSLNGDISIIDLGSGSARDIIGTLERNPRLTGSVSIDCVDTDFEALQTAEQLVREKGIAQSFRFSHKSLTQLSYRREADLGLLIGILCGLDHRACVSVLRMVKRYFKKGGILIASNVLEVMPEQDSVFACVLQDIIGWKLVYKTPEELQKIFEEAGYEWKGCFYDEPTRFHAMGIGMVPLN